MKMNSTIKTAIAIPALLALSSAAEAHVGAGGTSGLGAGLAHPLSGFDHVLAMLAVGLYAGQRRGRALWLVPLSFVTLMAVGGILGAAGVAIPFVETGIAASILLLGCLVWSRARLPVAASAILAGLFAIFHGHAHGTEMLATASGLAYGAGFLAATAGLHALGIALSLSIERAGRGRLVRYAGAAIAAAGAILLLG